MAVLVAEAEGVAVREVDKRVDDVARPDVVVASCVVVVVVVVVAVLEVVDSVVVLLAAALLPPLINTVATLTPALTS